MKQSGGDNSTNLQIETYSSYGLSYADTRDLCRDLVKEELDKYKLDAKVKALERNERFVEAFLHRAEAEGIGDKSVLSEFGNPDMQYVFLQAQKAFIKDGTESLEYFLIELLVERMKEQKKSIFQIALNEAIITVPILTSIEIDVLSIFFLFQSEQVNDQNELDSFCNLVMSLTPRQAYESSAITQLLFAKCIIYQEQNWGIVGISECIICSTYFQKPFNICKIKFSRPDLYSAIKRNSCMIKKRRDGAYTLNNPLSCIPHIKPGDLGLFISEYRKRLIDPQQAMQQIVNSLDSGGHRPLYPIISEINYKSFDLSIVGSIIGSINIKNKLNIEYDYRTKRKKS